MLEIFLICSYETDWTKKKMYTKHGKIMMRTWEMGSLFLSNESLELYISRSFYNWFVLLLSFSLVHTFQARTLIALEIDDWQWSVIKHRLFYDAFKFLNGKNKTHHHQTSTFKCLWIKSTLLTGPVDLYPVSLTVLYYICLKSAVPAYCSIFNFIAHIGMFFM